MFALTCETPFRPSTMRQRKVENSTVEDTVTIYGNDSTKHIAHIRFDREASRVGGCGMVVLLSRAYKRPDQLKTIQQFVASYFENFGQLSTFGEGQAAAPFSIDVPYYAARLVLTTLFEKSILPSTKKATLLEWVDSLEEYGTCAENLNCLNTEAPQFDAILDGIVGHLQRLEDRKIRCDIIDIVYVYLSTTPHGEWKAFFDAFQLIPFARLLRTLNFASKEKTHHFPNIAAALSRVADEHLDLVMHATDVLLGEVKSRINYMEATIEGINALLAEGRKDAVDFLLSVLKGKKDGKLITKTISIIIHAIDQQAAQELITVLLRDPKERGTSIENLYRLVVEAPNDQIAVELSAMSLASSK